MPCAATVVRYGHQNGRQWRCHQFSPRLAGAKIRCSRYLRSFVSRASLHFDRWWNCGMPRSSKRRANLEGRLKVPATTGQNWSSLVLSADETLRGNQGSVVCFKGQPGLCIALDEFTGRKSHQFHRGGDGGIIPQLQVAVVHRAAAETMTASSGWLHALSLYPQRASQSSGRQLIHVATLANICGQCEYRRQRPANPSYCYGHQD